MKATQAHPDVQANEKKKQKLAESLEWTEAFHPRIVYDKGGRMVPPTQPANGGYNPDLVPLSDIFTRHLGRVERAQAGGAREGLASSLCRRRHARRRRTTRASPSCASATRTRSSTTPRRSAG